MFKKAFNFPSFAYVIDNVKLVYQDKYAVLKEKLKDIPGTNFKLGLYHLKQGNLRDAALRFKFVSKLSPNDPEPYFYLAVSLLLANKEQEALEAITKALSHKPNWPEALYLKQKLSDATPPAVVPDFFIQLHTSHQEVKRTANAVNYNEERAQYVVRNILQHVRDKNPNWHVLDLDSKQPGYTLLLRQKDIASLVTATSLSKTVLNQPKIDQSVRKPVFDYTAFMTPLAFLSQPREHPFDLIIADQSLGHYGELDFLFTHIKQNLAHNGIFAFITYTLPDSSKLLDFDKKTDLFMFSEGTLHTALTAAGFRLLNTIPMNLPVTSDTATDSSEASLQSKKASGDSLIETPIEKLLLYQA